MIIAPAMRGFLKAKTVTVPPPVVTFATVAAVPPSTPAVRSLCSVSSLPGGSAWLEYVSGGINAGIYIAGGHLLSSGLTVTNGMAGLYGQTDASPSPNTTVTVTMRLRTVSGGTILGTYTFSVITNAGN